MSLPPRIKHDPLSGFATLEMDCPVCGKTFRFKFSNLILTHSPDPNAIIQHAEKQVAMCNHHHHMMGGMMVIDDLHENGKNDWLEFVEKETGVKVEEKSAYEEWERQSGTRWRDLYQKLQTQGYATMVSTPRTRQSIIERYSRPLDMHVMDPREMTVEYDQPPTLGETIRQAGKWLKKKILGEPADE